VQEGGRAGGGGGGKEEEEGQEGEDEEQEPEEEEEQKGEEREEEWEEEEEEDIAQEIPSSFCIAHTCTYNVTAIRCSTPINLFLTRTRNLWMQLLHFQQMC